jgi:hypothetical protein
MKSGRPPKNVERVLQAARQDLVGLLVLDIAINEIEHVHRPPCLTEALDPAEALLEP